MKMKIILVLMMIVIVQAADYISYAQQSPKPAIIGSLLEIKFISTFRMVNCTWIRNDSAILKQSYVLQIKEKTVTVCSLEPPVTVPTKFFTDMFHVKDKTDGPKKCQQLWNND